SGLDDPGIIENSKKIGVDTPYGEPSSGLTLGEIGGVEVAMLARHGREHQFSPGQVNYRANIHALKATGATHIIATTACGSLRKRIDRGHFVILDQFIDFTKTRKTTFFESFEDGAHHTAMADPFDPELSKRLYEASKELGFPTHDGGTVVTIEGPRFSTRAESNMFRIWGADVINMSIAPEAILANEAGVPYAAVAMSTDYDCWKTDEAPVTWDEILAVFEANSEKVKELLIKTVSEMGRGA
ncbi:MAG: S-methyl-5'-thioadenosine phosphorylase, partial [Desulfobacterales bacterium]|nr:S-methyl-5'-thioadenosine phosphorylase [Desulfobacterales bacterium]